MTARTGMSDIITELRGLAEAGTADYSLGSSTYWSDDHLQNILDAHRTDVVFEQLKPLPTYGTGGTLIYNVYKSKYAMYEATTGGTSIFYVQDGAGTTAGTTLYSADYRRGVVTFAADTSGTVTYYLTGRTYDVNAAAADVWRRKASHYAPSAFDFSTDNHSVSRSQVYAHCLEMATYYEGKSGDSIQTVSMYRGDLG